MNRIVIQYLSRTSDHHWATGTVHAKDADSKRTLCGRYPMQFTLTEDAVTCKKCLEEMQAQQSKSEEKPVEHHQSTTPQKQPRVREPYGSLVKYHRSPSKGNPEFGTSRTWVLTPKGQALVDKWEREEAEK